MNLAEGLTLGLIYTMTIVAEGLGAVWISPERTYWPVLRLQKATLAAALTWYVSVAVLSVVQPTVLSDFVANTGGVALVLLNSLWTLYLIWKRNRVPGFLLFDLIGIPHQRRPDFERAMLDAASAARHALLNEHQVDIMAASVERYRSMTPDQRERERNRAVRALRRPRRGHGGIE